MRDGKSIELRHPLARGSQAMDADVSEVLRHSQAAQSQEAMPVRDDRAASNEAGALGARRGVVQVLQLHLQGARR